jgi:DNA replication protein DnaC
VTRDEDRGLEEWLRRLNLANARRCWRTLVERAEREHWGYEQFLATLLAEEIAHRQGTRLRRVARQAHFPFLKTIDEFDFTLQSTVKLQVLGSFLSPDFVTDGRALILSGKPGRGKTHLAIAIAYRAIQNGFDARFVTAAALIDELSHASRQGRLRETLAEYVRPAVLVVDELGYLTYGTDAANVLFHVVNERHLRRRAMVFTTNKPPAAWGQVLHDEDLGAAIVDRILERGRHLKLEGPSARTRHLGAEGDTETENLARVSGTGPADFQEPT